MSHEFPLVLGYEDVMLVPQYSEISSRSEVNTSVDFLGLKLTAPIIASNMDTISEQEMAIAMTKAGGAAVLHRYTDRQNVLNWIKAIKEQGAVAIPSIGAKVADWGQIAIDYCNAGADAICIDVAHGDASYVVEMIKFLKENTKINIIAGNVATYSGAYRLAEAGADAIRVGVGGGSCCTTRIQTGHGIPMVSTLEECCAIKSIFPHVKILADGGAKHPGDFVKALALGADVVMTGRIFAGCNEVPTIGKKCYRGMASFQSQTDFRGQVNNGTPEGESFSINPTGKSVKDVVQYYLGGIRSGMTYSGAKDLKQLKENAQFVQITHSGWIESTPHFGK